jgi:hypothetical protein
MRESLQAQISSASNYPMSAETALAKTFRQKRSPAVVPQAISVFD